MYLTLGTGDLCLHWLFDHFRQCPLPVYKPCCLNILDTLGTQGQGMGSSLFLDCWSDVLGDPLLYSL